MSTCVSEKSTNCCQPSAASDLTGITVFCVDKQTCSLSLRLIKDRMCSSKDDEDQLDRLGIFNIIIILIST